MHWEREQAAISWQESKTSLYQTIASSESLRVREDIAKAFYCVLSDSNLNKLEPIPEPDRTGSSSCFKVKKKLAGVNPSMDLCVQFHSFYVKQHLTDDIRGRKEGKDLRCPKNKT